MSSKLSTVFESLQAQQLPALITILEKAKEHAAASGIDEKDLLERRLIEDMHPLIWQIQAVLELSLRALARLTSQDLPTLQLSESDFDGVIARAREVIKQIGEYDLAGVDDNAATSYTIPLGPEMSMTLTGEEYVLKFYLPNFYFHLTTAYNLVRSAGVPIGKREFMGPVRV